MRAIELIGSVGATVVKGYLSASTAEDGVARLMLDQLTGEQVEAIVKALLVDPSTESRVSIRIPRSLVGADALPAAVLTDERTVSLRNRAWDTPALLIANTDDDQGTSLQDVTKIGAKVLVSAVDLWVGAASSSVSLPPAQRDIWVAALKGLVAAETLSLHQVASYVALTLERVSNESKPLDEALGWALPAIQLPRDSGYFQSMRPNDQIVPAKWKKLFEKVASERSPLLEKRRRNGQAIQPEEFQSQWANVEEDVPQSSHATIIAFIGAPPRWCSEVGALIELEWEAGGVNLLFSGLRQKKLTLGQETLEYFEYDLPDRLTGAEKEYLQQLKKSKSQDTNDEDLEFFERHGVDIAHNKSLRAKWERFVFGKPIETEDFLAGLLLALERLYGQIASSTGKRTLTIRSSRRTKSQLLALNADVATAFSVKYRGLPQLFGKEVEWDVPHLFQYEELLEQAKARNKKKYRRNESKARANLQIKFEVILKVAQGASIDTRTVQVVWAGNPDGIGNELPDDLERLIRRPFVACEVARRIISKKGSIQTISLRDTATLEPAFGRDSGSVVPQVNRSVDLEKKFKQDLASAIDGGRISVEGGGAVSKAWDAFATSYKAALEGWRNQGLSGDLIFQQAEDYRLLLDSLRKFAPGDRNRQSLWQTIASIGVAFVNGGAPTAIITPWHPLRLVSMAIKARSVGGLYQHVLRSEEVNFGDSRLFFSDLVSELEHPWYPEVTVGYLEGVQPVLLHATDTVNDYSLMERPVTDPSEAVTDVDPREGAREIRSLVERYLELQPHECSNLSLMLYNCDAAGLPFETVNVLGALNDGEEIHCNVLVRHRDRATLSDVYGELLERAEGDPDAIVASEASRNFMSKLRIGVMMTNGSGSTLKRHEVDVAFLHDVVSRQAKETWVSVPVASTPATWDDHVPARWSYRQVSTDAELKATNFLACPRQPRAGWAYLDMVAGLVEQKTVPSTEHRLPARQISFQDQALKGMFDEVHNLAEWVATYDDLLDRQQLRAQGINVIRYRRQKTNGRNVVVSSMSDLNILRVLVKRRLNELSLGLDSERLSKLADRFIDDALKISGDIVLRAAKRGVSAGELIGLVLSQALVGEELGQGEPIAWFLLDDYAVWLGQKEERIADILALSVVVDKDGSYKLRVAITEAKYVGADNAAEACKGSQQQLRQTVARIEDALFGDPGRLDRDLWLSRIADLLLDSSMPVGTSAMLEAVRDGIRQGSVPIELRGYSHVFVSGPSDGGGVKSEQEEIADIKVGLQELFGRQEVRELVQAYEVGKSLTPIREKLGSSRPWNGQNFRAPAARVQWIIKSSPDHKAVRDAEDLKNNVTADAERIGKDAIEAPEPPTIDDSLPEPPASGTAPDEMYETPPQAATTEFPFPALVEEKASQNLAATEGENEWLETIVQRLRSALMGYGFQAKVVGSRLTPNAALIRFSGSDRLGVENIEAKRSALLTTHGLKLVSVLPLPGEIVVAVERPQRQTVSLWDVWARRELNSNAVGLNTSFILGLKELDGEILYLNLGSAFGGEPQHEPHSLIAGATGSGKSVLIQALILDIAATNPSDLAHIILIDPKMGVDYVSMERLPHVQGGIIIEQSKAIEVLEGLVGEMDRRYELFRRASARDLKTYNVKAPVEERLPMIYLIHDEFAEWMMTEDYKDAVTSSVQRLGVKARAAGIHLIFAAQRPDANVMPVQLRDNLGNRLILKVASVGTSEIALGMKGAESLLGLGHLAARLSGQVHFAQAPFLSDEDLDLAVDAIVAGDEIGRRRRHL